MLAITRRRPVLFVTAVLILAALTLHFNFYIDELDSLDLNALSRFESEQQVSPNGMLSFFKSTLAPDLTKSGIISDTFKRAAEDVHPSHSRPGQRRQPPNAAVSTLSSVPV